MWEDVNTDLIDEGLIEDAIYETLNKLAPRHAQAVMLRNGFDCTYKEIGKLLAYRLRELEISI